MFIQNKKVLPWTGENYAKTILTFALHTFIIIALFVLAMLCNSAFDFAIVGEYLSEKVTMRNLLYAFLAVCMISVGTYLYFYYEYRDFIMKISNINMIFIIIEISMAVSYFVGNKLSVFARPFAMCALLALLLIDKRPSIFLNTTYAILMFLMDSYTNNQIVANERYSSLIMSYTTGLLAVYLVYGISSRVKVFLQGFVLAIPVTVGAIFLKFDYFLEKPSILIVHGLTSGMLSVVLMMALLPFFENIFNVVTDYRLSEITDHKSKLIKMLIERAPGTFNHSLVVSTLAESCANAIGENALLARACAYYHDMGKLRQPEYFTENQSGYNPHNELTPELSTDIIRSHARDGYDIIKKYRLPQILADVAVQHHGTLPIRYFYAKAMKYTEGDLDIENFSYPGPKPQTKIAAIIMLADGCEAAVRTLTDRSHAKVDEVVREIIEERMSYDQFSECEITMKDIDIIRRTITNSLAGVYHDRVAYPKLKVSSNSYARQEAEKLDAQSVTKRKRK